MQACQWQGSHYLVFHQFLVAGEKQDKSVHSSRLPPIISTKEILRRRTLFNRNGFVKKNVDLLLLEKEVQYSLLFPDIFVSVGGDKQDFSNLI